MIDPKEELREKHSLILDEIYRLSLDAPTMERDMKLKDLEKKQRELFRLLLINQG